MAKYARGLICLSLTEQKLRELNLPLMVSENRAPLGTAFTISIDAAQGISTGISAADRAKTIQTAVRDGAKPSDLVSPGHIFPLKAVNGGVLVRAGQTEGSVDLARLAGLKPAGVICEIMNEDGTMARRPQLEEFAKRHNLNIVTIADLIRYRMRNESLIRREASREIVLGNWGEFRLFIYSTLIDTVRHMVLIRGDISPGESTLVRVHSCCILGDVFDAGLCNCGYLLRRSLDMIKSRGNGVLLYINPSQPSSIELPSFGEHSSRGPNIHSRRNTRQIVREFGIGAQILADIGAKRIKLLTNNPKKLIGLKGFGLDIDDIIPIGTPING
jgi:3,4-dihydroxy 2-butanone 4-phosphate synthase/GTP cyclohydrolase II